MDDHQQNLFNKNRSSQPSENKNKVTAAFSSQSLGSASKTKLCIQIKSTKIREPCGDESPAELHRPGHRVCDVCGKEFSSGKAWGGHKRHHVNHNYKKKQRQNLQLNNHRPKFKKYGCKSAARWGCNFIKAGDVMMSGGKPTCCLCHRNFESMISLFKHMKTHPPDKGRRGTQVPSFSDKNSCCSSISETAGLEVEQISSATEKCLEGGIDLLRSLRSLVGWSKTDRRGRVTSISDPIPQAACDLLTLSRDTRRSDGQRIERSPGRYKSEFSPQKLKIKEPTTTGLASKSSGAKASGDDVLIEMNRRRGKAVLEDGSIQKVVSRDCQWGYSEWPGGDADNMNQKFVETLNYSDEVGMMIHKAKKVMKPASTGKLRASETIEGALSCDHIHTKATMRTDGFSCSTCEKSFPSFQALGGHRSSCPGKNKSTQHMDESALVDNASSADEKSHLIPSSAADDIQESEQDGSIPAGYTFQCDVCNKTFLTGQALGGHKRCHWNLPTKATSKELALPGESSQAGGGTILHGRRILDIDLNKPYIMQDGEEI